MLGQLMLELANFELVAESKLEVLEDVAGIRVERWSQKNNELPD